MSRRFDRKDRRAGSASDDGALIAAMVAGVIFLGGFVIGWLWGKNPTGTYRITRDIKRRMAAEAQRTAEKDDVPEGSACVVCLSAERQMVFCNCGHACMCEACVFTAAGGADAREDVLVVLRCPLCRVQGTLCRMYG